MTCKKCIEATLKVEMPRAGYRSEYSDVAARGILHSVSIGRTPLVKCSEHK